MIGQQIEYRPPFPFVALTFFLIALALGVGALIEKNVHVAIGAVLPLFLSVALWLARRNRFSARFTETALEVDQPEVTVIPYDSLEGLRAKGRSSDPTKPGPRSYPMTVIHRNGVMPIPAHLNLPADDVYLFLLEQFPPEGSHEVSPVLAEYREKQESAFGPDRVWAYRARNHLGYPGGYRQARAIWLGAAAAGVVWILLSFSVLPFKHNFGWAIAGSILAAFSLIFFAAFWAESKRPPVRLKHWRQASLVISPVGLAMVQGDIKGEMRWDELRDVQLTSKPGSFQFGASLVMPGILLKVAGATIIIADIYDQPLRIIFERIRRYWK
jgi:hypothetical protein